MMDTTVTFDTSDSMELAQPQEMTESDEMDDRGARLNIDRTTGIRYGVIGTEAVPGWAERRTAPCAGLWSYCDPPYEAHQWDGESQVFIVRSDHYTLCQVQGAGAPGAGNLGQPASRGRRAYCFGPEWFAEGLAPYPVYRVADGTLVAPPAPAPALHRRLTEWCDDGDVA